MAYAGGLAAFLFVTLSLGKRLSSSRQKPQNLTRRALTPSSLWTAVARRTDRRAFKVCQSHWYASNLREYGRGLGLACLGPMTSRVVVSADCDSPSPGRDCPPYPARFHRLATNPTNPLIGRRPYGLPDKLYRLVAVHLPFFA